MHCRSLIEPHEYVIGVWYFCVGRQEMRNRIKIPQIAQHRRLAIAKADVPGRYAKVGSFIGHLEEVFEGQETRLEVQELAVLVEVAQIGRVALVEILEVREIEQFGCSPVCDTSFYDDRLQGIRVWLDK